MKSIFKRVLFSVVAAVAVAVCGTSAFAQTAPLEFSGALAKAPDAKAPELRAPAPPLSRIIMFAVGSSNCGWEYMTTIGQISTTCDHGGAQLRAVVQEIGYGGTPIAWMQGGLLPNSANYLNEAICIVNGYYTTACPNGATIVGWYRYFNLDGYQNGQFQEQNTSIVSPFNTLSTFINIL
ncbi:hypothetical protein AH2_00039 [Burkholderia phage vB_BceS_AH2]|uniref:DUF4879 domain-containing protein n=1 Tax=Burkholderia phage vB_BceS_AH2 TaxID=1133022 RepID=I6NTM5_9CAUD|nr:hypothetical protein B613_gp39 [Burkholderia phage vB_BceS_AH2]AEY69549.1 hypothetical protein AH2_00039 [Burkholderia phage vB_BceS_AH2]